MKIVLNREELQSAIAHYYGNIPRGYQIAKVDINEYRGRDEFCVVNLEPVPVDLEADAEIDRILAPLAVAA